MHGLDLLKPIVGRIGFVFLIVLVFVATASAYTVVMHGGRRVEIPSRFVLTSATLTYEVSPGVQVTLAVAAIDIPATERANNEQPGSLLRRAESSLPESPGAAENSKPTAPVPQPRRTITNRDLESSMRRRRDSEVAYESRRKQLGLPSVEESRRQAAAEADSIRLELKQRRVVEEESENYWRERATALRTEMASVDAELTYVRSRLDEAPVSNRWTTGWSSLSFNTITRGAPFGGFGRTPFGTAGGRAAYSPSRVSSPNIFVAPRASAQISGRVGFGGGTVRGQVFLNPRVVRQATPVGPVGVGGHFRASVGFGNLAVPGLTVPTYDYSYERSALITHFNELAAARAGLNARWRELEEEARRAGAPPGWLRP
jgi:hypothetical protein